jgi:hypothetical protein
MTKNQKIIVIVAVMAAIMAMLWLGWDISQREREITCNDGRRRIIDMRDFTTTYWAYSVTFEASIRGGNTFSASLDPKQFQQLSESFLRAKEFQKMVVAGWNGCAISKAQYLRYSAKFAVLDNIARQMDSLVKEPTLTEAARSQLSDLVQRYIELTRELGNESK